MENHLELLRVAQEDTGLSDYGEDSFREGLEILVKALNNEARLNDTGERALRERITAHLKQRLQVEDWYRRHPEIDQVEIRAPLFGISLPRTGSTALSFLLACDPQIRYLRRWESSQPCPPPSTVEGDDPRRHQAGELDRRAGEKPHTPTGIDGPMECQDLMSLDFKSQMFQAFAQIPSYSDWLLEADLASTYRYERRVLKLLQWGEPQRPWRLKAPTHMLYMHDLDSAFPDARFVMTHRDPTDVIVSVATVYADLVGLFTDEVDYGYLGELNVRTWTEGIKRAMAFRREGAEKRFYDIHFKTMHADPIAQVRGLYDWLGEPVSPKFEANMQHWWRDNTENREPSVHRDPALFGLDLEQVRPQFAEYIQAMSAWTGGHGS